ncbi:MAG: hypothetical protein IJK67_04865 [Bacilli bacterium]|nr:hypothetical protein [Bacilli bacterium]
MKFDRIDSPQELLKYMDMNIKYGFVGKNGRKYFNQFSEEWNDWYEQCIVQTGEEMLKSGIGTCWDQVELERLWFEKNNYEIKTIFIWFEVNYENNYPTHTFLLFKKNNKWYWFEHAFESYKGIHQFDNIQEAIDYVITKQLEYAVKNNIAKLEDKKLIVAYEYTKLEKPIGVDEYFKHVTSGINLKKE